MIYAFRYAPGRTARGFPFAMSFLIAVRLSLILNSELLSDVLEKVVFGFVRAYRGPVQAEQAVVPGTPVFHVIIGFLLADVAAETGLGHFKGGFSSKGIQRS